MHWGYEMNCSPQSGRGYRPKLNEGLKKESHARIFKKDTKKLMGRFCSVTVLYLELI